MQEACSDRHYEAVTLLVSWCRTAAACLDSNSGSEARLMCMYDGADDIVILLSEHHRIAAKVHKCGECGRSIQAGETYLSEAGVFDSDFVTYKTCQHCEVARRWLISQCGGFLYEGIYEDVYEHLHEGHGFGVLRLVAGIKHRWQRKDGRLWPIPKLPVVSA